MRACVPRLPSLVEYVQQPLTAGLRDRAACVRRVAVLGWAKLHSLQPHADIGEEEGGRGWVTDTCVDEDNALYAPDIVTRTML
jgi:hypothetical protein